MAQSQLISFQVHPSAGHQGGRAEGVSGDHQEDASLVPDLKISAEKATSVTILDKRLLLVS